MAEYIPGVCNIGPAERSTRRLSGVIGLIVTFLGLVIMVILQIPSAVRLLLFFPTFAAAIGFLQDQFHFCAGFGLRGLYNVAKSTGDTDDVYQKEFRKQDRIKSFKIIAYSLAIAVIVALAAYWLS